MVHKAYLINGNDEELDYQEGFSNPYAWEEGRDRMSLNSTYQTQRFGGDLHVPDEKS